MKKLITLNEFITSRQSDFPHSKGELSRLLSALRLASKIVNREVGKAGLIEEIIGSSGNVNIQDEDQQKLDVYANNEFIAAMLAQEEICGIGSEENDDFIAFENEAARQGNYIVLMDPLDGSSNIDVNVSIGTIFSIYRRVSKPGEMAREEDFLQKGNKQVAAGYVIYGSSTMLVYSTGNGVNGFTLDPSIGVFILSHPNMKFPEDGKIYSVNEGNFNAFSEGVKEYITNCKNRSYSARYIGSFVADFHRNMIKGGIYMYPATISNKNGKLRLLYENNPLAFIAEQAGGKASTGTQNVLDIKPTELHQRTPLFIGSKKMVEEIEKLIAAEQK